MGGVVVRVVPGGFVLAACRRGETGCFTVGSVVGVGQGLGAG